MIRYPWAVLIHFVAVMIHGIVEAIAAVYAHWQVPHHHLCVPYAIASAASITLLVAIMREISQKQRMSPGQVNPVQEGE